MASKGWVEGGPPGGNGHHAPLSDNDSNESESSTTRLTDPSLDKSSTFYYLDWPNTPQCAELECGLREYISKERLYDIAEEVRTKPGTHVFFLPRINIIEEDAEFCKKLAELFLIDNFFLTKRGYKSNGFFRSSKKFIPALNATCRTSASRFLVKEISEVHDRSSKDRLRRTIQTFRDKLPLADEELQSFSVPDDPPTRLAEEFLRSLKAKKDASTEKLQWLESLENPSGEESRWLAKFEPQVRDFSRSPVQENVEKLFESCDVESSLLRKDETVANTFISIIAEVLTYGIHHGNCIIGVKPKEANQSTDSRDLLQSSDLQSTANLKEKDAVGKNRKQIMGYIQPLCKRDKGSLEQRQNDKKKYDTPIYTYHWLFLAFFTLTLDRGGTTDDGSSDRSKSPKHYMEGRTQILLCFDNAQGKWMEDAIKEVDMGVTGHSTAGCPHGHLPQVVEAIARVYDNALWGFRVPIRNIEKHRRGPIKSMTQRRSTTTADDDLDLTKSYSDMHELSRHMDHILEALRAAKNTMNAIMADCEGQVNAEATRAGSEMSGQPDSRVKFWAMFIANLELRAVSFNERLENEISLAYHLVNVLQLSQARQLLEESRDEGKDIARYVAYASMIFLPGTFVSGFFSMTFFGFVPDNLSWQQSHKIWIYFLITVPVTIAGLAFIFLKHRNKERRRAKGDGQDNKVNKEGGLSKL